MTPEAMCPTCDDTGVVPTSSGRGSDGYDPCPDCMAPVPQADLVERLRDPWERGSMKAVNMHDEAADEIEALRGATRSLAGWVKELDPYPSLDPCDYLTDKAEQGAVRRAFAQLSSRPS